MRKLKLLVIYCCNCLKFVALNNRLDDKFIVCTKCGKQINKDIKEADKIEVDSKFG